MTKMTNEQVLACQKAQMSAAEAARSLGVTRQAIAKRGKKLKITFARKRRHWSRRYRCFGCAKRKLCLLCHRLHVAALPCEATLILYDGEQYDESMADPCVWPAYLLKLGRR